MSARNLKPPCSKIYSEDKRFFQNVDIYVRRHTPSESARVMCVIPIIYNNNNKDFLVHPMKVCRGRRVVDPLMLNLSKRWR